MNQKRKNKIIEIYEQVACGIIIPNKARLEFLKIIKQEIRRVIGRDETRCLHFQKYKECGCFDCMEVNNRNQFRAEQRRKAGLG